MSEAAIETRRVVTLASNQSAERNAEPFGAELPLFLTRCEVADLLRISERTVRRTESEGRLRSLKLTPGKAGRVLFRREELLRLVADVERLCRQRVSLTSSRIGSSRLAARQRPCRRTALAGSRGYRGPRLRSRNLGSRRGSRDQF